MQQFYHSEIRWAVREIKESSEELLNKLNKKELYLTQLSNISTENRKQEWLSVRLLLKELLNEEKEIAYTGSGRPYLPDNTYQISISHTKGYVAVALHPHLSIGIDLEYISSRILKIKHRFMSDKELSDVNSSIAKEIHLLLYWSAKESIFKSLREEGVDFREHLHIEAFEPVFNQLGNLQAYETKTKKGRCFNVLFTTNKNYVLTLTSASISLPDDFVK